MKQKEIGERKQDMDTLLCHSTAVEDVQGSGLVQVDH
jgi:hypothetical protein